MIRFFIGFALGSVFGWGSYTIAALSLARRFNKQKMPRNARAETLYKGGATMVTPAFTEDSPGHFKRVGEDD